MTHSKNQTVFFYFACVKNWKKMKEITTINAICIDLCDHEEVECSCSQYKFALDVLSNKKKRRDLIETKASAANVINLL